MLVSFINTILKKLRTQQVSVRDYYWNLEFGSCFPTIIKVFTDYRDAGVHVFKKCVHLSLVLSDITFLQWLSSVRTLFAIETQQRGI